MYQELETLLENLENPRGRSEVELHEDREDAVEAIRSLLADLRLAEGDLFG